jgi:hypothetical protein
MQGDRERALGLPISPLMDRDQAGGMTQSQVLSALPEAPASSKDSTHAMQASKLMVTQAMEIGHHALVLCHYNPCFTLLYLMALPV